MNLLSQCRLFYLKISTIDHQAARFSLFCLCAVGSKKKKKRPRSRSVDCLPWVAGAKMQPPRPSGNAHAMKRLYASVAAGRRRRGIDDRFELFHHWENSDRKMADEVGKVGKARPNSGWAIIYPLIGVALYWMAPTSTEAEVGANTYVRLRKGVCVYVCLGEEGGRCYSISIGR